MQNILWSIERRELDRLRVEMDRLFDRFLDFRHVSRTIGRGDWWLPVDVLETSKEIIVQAEIPGIDAEAIEITLQGRLLTIRGEKKRDYGAEGDSACRVERKYGTFSRSIEIPVEVNSKEIKATYERGVLKLNMQRINGHPAKKIKVKLL
jgi:HSP20 family protein